MGKFWLLSEPLLIVAYVFAVFVEVGARIVSLPLRFIKGSIVLLRCRGIRLGRHPASKIVII